MSVDLDPETEKWILKHLNRCKVLTLAIIQIQKIYFDENTNEDQRNFLETIIGAGIWYISSKGISTMKISEGILKDYHPESGIKRPKISEDHEYPRKVAAKELLEKDWDCIEEPAIEFLNLYLK